MAAAPATVADGSPTTPEIPFSRGTMRMGLSPLAPREWIDLGADHRAQMAAKQTLLVDRRDQVLVHLPGSEDASREALDVLAANLAAFHLGPYQSNGSDGLITPIGEVIDLAADRHPLETAARLVQEDLCVLPPGAAEAYRLAAGCVCFPSNWSLPEKLGLPIGAIHGPVPGFDATLASPVDRFFARLGSGQLVWRLNWLVHDSPELFQLGREPNPAGTVTPGNAGETTWLRTERQVLQRLPRTGAVLFSIRTRVIPLRDAITSPAKAAELAAALRAMPPALQTYRHMGPFIDPLIAWLDLKGASARP